MKVHRSPSTWYDGLVAWIENILHFGRWQIRDARGVRFSLYSPISEWAPGRTREGPTRAEINAIVAREREDHRFSSTSHTIFFTIIFLLFARFVNRFLSHGIFKFMDGLLLFVLFLGLWHISGSYTKLRPERFAKGLLEVGRCPHCAYGLSNATVDPDGCTVCPECGGAWNRPGQHESRRTENG